jgi:hypothetical protein
MVGDAAYCLSDSAGIDSPLTMTSCDHYDLNQRFFGDSRGSQKRIMRGTMCIGFDSCPWSTTESKTTGTAFGAKMLGCSDGTFCNADTATGGSFECCISRGNQRRQCPVRSSPLTSRSMSSLG